MFAGGAVHAPVLLSTTNVNIAVYFQVSNIVSLLRQDELMS